MILLTLSFYGFIIWAVAQIGKIPSISSLFLHPKTKWTYTMAMPMVALTIIFTQQDPMLQASAAALILGTAAPDYTHKTSLSKYFHYGFTGLAALFGWWAVAGVWLGIAAVLMLVIAKVISSIGTARNAVFWAEILLFAVVFQYLIINT